MTNSKIITPIITAPPPEPQLAAKPPDPVRKTTLETTPNTQATPVQNQIPQATPGPTVSPAQQPEAINIPLSETGSEKETSLTQLDKAQLYLNLSWKKSMTILLALQGLFGLYTSIHFILVEYPILENKLAAHIVTQGEVNVFASQAIIIVISTLLSMIFAVKLSVMKSKISKIIQKVVFVVLFLANTFVMKYLNQIGSAEIVNRFTTSVIDLLRNIL